MSVVKKISLHELIDLNCPQVMGILNVTPDSFSDGGKFLDVNAAVRRAVEMQEEGAAIIDVGGESSRPGAQAVSEEQERDRVIGVIEAIACEIDIPISIDTMKPSIMREAVRVGARLINDINALQNDEAMLVAAQSGVPVCLMHMQGEPRTMQTNPRYENVIHDISHFFRERIAACIAAGISHEQIILDPGFGFGKTTAHNLSLVAQLDEFHRMNCPLLIGVSRKATIGALLNKPVTDRLYGSLSLAVLALMKGVRIIRAHDVGATCDAINIAHEVMQHPLLPMTQEVFE